MMLGSLGNPWSLASLFLVCLAGAVSAQSSKPAAMVNGEPIPVSEVESVLAMRGPELFPVPQAQKRLLRLEILDGLIGERLLRQYLAKNVPPIETAEVDKQMSALAESQKAAGKTLKDFCKETHQTEAQVRASIHNMLQFSAFARQQATDDHLRKYFQANLEYFQKVTVRVSHIVLRLPSDATEADRQDARKKLLDLRQKITGSQVTFADAAKEFSQCPSAPKGGDIGFIARKWMVDEAVARAAFALKKNDLSGIVESEFGLHLLLVTDRTDPKPIEFAACLDDVRDCYVEEMRQHLMTQLRKSAKIEILLK